MFWHLRYELARNKDSTSKTTFMRQHLRTTTSVETEIGRCQINMRGMMGKKSQSVLFYFNLTYSLSHTPTVPPPFSKIPSLCTPLSLFSNRQQLLTHSVWVSITLHWIAGYHTNMHVCVHTLVMRVVEVNRAEHTLGKPVSILQQNQTFVPL